MQSIDLPERVLSSINHTLYTFLWKKKNSNKKAFLKVKSKVLMQDYDKGGLKMIGTKILQSALYLSWIPKLITKSTDKWKVFPKNLLPAGGRIKYSPQTRRFERPNGLPQKGR